MRNASYISPLQTRKLEKEHANFGSGWVLINNKFCVEFPKISTVKKVGVPTQFLDGKYISVLANLYLYWGQDEINAGLEKIQTHVQD